MTAEFRFVCEMTGGNGTGGDGVEFGGERAGVLSLGEEGMGESDGVRERYLER